MVLMLDRAALLIERPQQTEQCCARIVGGRNSGDGYQGSSTHIDGLSPE
jgi:hypothetical protein